MQSNPPPRPWTPPPSQPITAKTTVNLSTSTLLCLVPVVVVGVAGGIVLAIYVLAWLAGSGLHSINFGAGGGGGG